MFLAPCAAIYLEGGAVSYSRNPSSNQQYRVGTYADHSCHEADEWYSLAGGGTFGDSRRWCQGNGEWSGQPFSCSNYFTK